MKPTLKHEDNRLKSKTFKHPAYGLVSVCRGQSSHDLAFFGSEITHHNIVTLSIHTADEERMLNSSRQYPRKQLIEVAMTMQQWAGLLSSMNFGNGVCCTIKRINHERLPEISLQPTVNVWKAEMEDTQNVIKEAAIGADKIAKDMLSGKLKMNKGNLKDLADHLDCLVRNADSNTKFVMKQFIKNMERVVGEAKAEVNAHAQTVIEKNG